MLTQWSVGSRWLRWDPHLHAPGTLRNNQFGTDWDSYLTTIENAVPSTCALGITDYFSLRAYKHVLDFKRQGRLAGVSLIFPNVELRLTVETRRGAGINLHLLFCPDDPDHVALAEGMLSRLKFPYRGMTFQCTEKDLQRLGRLYTNRTDLPDDAALSAGANQFKVHWHELRQLRDEDTWIQDNVLFAVAAGEDGLAGISKDSSFAAERDNLGRLADIIFSSSAADRKYWSGDHPGLLASGQRQKPCLHGSDAHTLSRVLAPDDGRQCWLRAEPTFDGLRQTLVEPLRRVYIGLDPPPGPSPSNVIRNVTLRNADWAQTPFIQLNDGLVTIIGAKGSGKTALADLIAFGAYSEESHPGPASFIAKAEDLLAGAIIEIEWGDGTRVTSVFPRSFADYSEPRVRYLSQQFVERLCSAAGVSEPLIDEIEAVVFSAVPEDERCMCANFEELRTFLLQGIITERERCRDTVREQTFAIAEDNNVRAQASSIRSKVVELERNRLAAEQELKLLPLSANEKIVAEYNATLSKLTGLRETIASLERNCTLMANLIAEIQDETKKADIRLHRHRHEYGDLLTELDWELLRFRPHATAQAMLQASHQKLYDRIATLRTSGLPTGTKEQPLGLEALVLEEKRLSDALGKDKANARRRIDITKKVSEIKKLEEHEQRRLIHADGASKRQQDANTIRLDAYQALFATMVDEQCTLERLYTPLHIQLTETKLSFYVQRIVDIDAWSMAGEHLLDLRRPPFAGRGVLAQLARSELLSAWTTGSPPAARAALESFIAKHAHAAVDTLAAGATPSQFGDWLFSTDHIRVEYGLKYEGVPLSHLSPGTRGVLLLTLYLGLDYWDDRPLVIDQPEENLDPKSVYADLVPFFRDAASRRQIIMVTHNANLVVNTDSDQVIVTTSERDAPEALPSITYMGGGLEEPEIRRQVCALLEGGEDAFRKRGQRYGMRS